MFSNNDKEMEVALSNPSTLKFFYDDLKRTNRYTVEAANPGGLGSYKLLSDNKFNTKNMVNFSYEELINLKYNNIYAYEIFSYTKYRTLHVIKI